MFNSICSTIHKPKYVLISAAITSLSWNIFTLLFK